MEQKNTRESMTNNGDFVDINKSAAGKIEAKDSQKGVENVDKSAGEFDSKTSKSEQKNATNFDDLDKQNGTENMDGQSDGQGETECRGQIKGVQTNLEIKAELKSGQAPNLGDKRGEISSGRQANINEYNDYFFSLKRAARIYQKRQEEFLNLPIEQ
ncbi:MAG: hypothetical protein FWD86_00420 [Firmicutes bacterium]|nr:hypothetical protein [Bacillota bacterium]